MLLGLITTCAFFREFPTLFLGKAHDDFSHFYCIINNRWLLGAPEEKADRQPEIHPCGGKEGFCCERGTETDWLAFPP